MAKRQISRRFFLSTVAATAAVLTAAPWNGAAQAQALKAGTVRVGLRNDMANFDPQQLSTVNFALIKNLYDSLIEYTAEGEAIPSLATEWTIADDYKSVTVKLRDGIKFHSGTALTAQTILPTLEKGSKAETGKNLFPTMGPVESFEAVDDLTLKLSFKQPVPAKQITDLLQFIIPIDPAVIGELDVKAGGTGPFMLEERQVGQSITLVKNPNYWRAGEPVLDKVVFTVFSDDSALAAGLESDVIDITYMGTPRSAERLQAAGYNVLLGPGKLMQTFRINSTRAPFTNKKFRQAFHYLMNRDAMKKLAYANFGINAALPWAPANPAYDQAVNDAYVYDIEKAKALFAESGLSQAEMENWKILTNGGDESVVLISQILQASLEEAGLKIELQLMQGSEYVDAQLQGNFDTTFGGVGNVQKFPTRVGTNSIYRPKGNPVLKDPHPHQAYVDAIARVESAFGDDVAPAYKALNDAILDEAFAISTHTTETGITVASTKLDGIELDIDNVLVLRKAGFK